MATIKFVDRKAAKPNRYLLTPEGGEAYYITLTRADEPIVEGTAINAEILNALAAYLETGVLAATVE